MSDFDPQRDIVIDASPSPDGLGMSLRTRGLARRGRPELEMLHVPEDRAEDAAVVLHGIADYVVRRSAVADGETLVVTAPAGALFARLAAGPTVGTDGFFGKLIKKATRVQRVNEPFDGMAHPKTLLSTVALWRARALIEEDLIDEAEAELEASIAWFPGDPARRSEANVPFPYNWENHLAYEALAELAEGEDRVRWLREAFARSEALERAVVGDGADALGALELETVTARVAWIAAENANAPSRREVAPGVVMIASPLRARVELEDGPVADRQLTVVPALFAEYQDALVEPTEAQRRLIAELVEAHAADSARLAAMTHDVRQLYEGGNEEAPSLGDPAPYRVGDRLLSLLLADIARRVYAGLSFEELRASYGRSDDAAAREAAEAKLEALEEQEAAAYLRAMGG